MQVQPPSTSSAFSLHIHLLHPRHGAIFTAVLSLCLLPPFSLSPSLKPKPESALCWGREAFEWALWLMPHRAAFWIYWQVGMWALGEVLMLRGSSIDATSDGSCVCH